MHFVQGIILSSFYWGYVVTHLPGGMLSERFGGKHSLGLGILATALFTLITPIAVDYGEATGLIAVRVLMGLCEGTTFPALNAMLAQWTPPEERSKIGSLVFAGAQLGTVFANSLSGLILHYSPIGWPAVFYVFGSIGIIWFLLWLITCYNNPDTHPFISEKERNFLRDRLHAHIHKKPPSVPWRHLLRSVPVWALIVAQIGHDWGFFTLINDLPKYMSNVLKYSIKSNGLLSALPYLTMWLCSVVTSCLADWMITSGFMSRTNVRKLGTTIASLGPGAFVIAASYAECERTIVVVMFTIGATLMGTYYLRLPIYGWNNYSILSFVSHSRYVLSGNEGERSRPESKLFRYFNGTCKRNRRPYRYPDTVHRWGAHTEREPHRMEIGFLDRPCCFRRHQSGVCAVRERRGGILERSRVCQKGARRDANESRARKRAKEN